MGELADEVGVSAKTIRYYESIGLLPGPPRTGLERLLAQATPDEHEDCYRQLIEHCST